MDLHDTGLPIEQVADELRFALAERKCAVLTAEPGAGKTTVVPLRLLGEPWLDDRRITMLEPRRLAARASAARMASMLGESVGETVGVTTRDDRRVSAATRIEVVTEGVLTRRLQNDPTLEGVGLVIFDEFHERSQQAELGLALLLDARSAFGADLGVLVMSATIDAPRVAEILDPIDPAPIIECAGRTFPIDVRWRPRNRRDHIEPAVADAVEWVVSHVPEGDVLVFLPGMAEIRRVQDKLRSLDPRFAIHVLHGSLPLEDQDRAVAPAEPGFRKVVLSTDIAESSLTVEGVTAVVDSGLARAPRFDPASGLTRLTTVSISRASADQRAGRAGRVREGTAVRLWSKIEHGTRSAFQAAELTKIDLAGVRLELAAWGVLEPDELAFLDPMPQAAWSEAGEILQMLNALDATGRITARGHELVNLPLHPRLASIAVTGAHNGMTEMASMVAALIDERDVLRGRPAEVPVDLSLRVALLADRSRQHPLASGRSIAVVRQRARDLERRVAHSVSGAASGGPIDRDSLGLLVAAGFPDRVAQRRGASRGRFRLRNGAGIRMPESDELAGEDFVVAVDVAGPRKDARVRLAAAVDLDQLLVTPGFTPEVTERILWDKGRNDLTLRADRHLGSLDLGSTNRRPEPSDEVTKLLVEHVRRKKLKPLAWTDSARSMQQRVQFLHTHRVDDQWPAVDDQALLATLNDWLAPLLAGATGRSDLEVLSMMTAFDVIIGHGRRHELDRLVPSHVELAGRRRCPIRYQGDLALVSSRAQDFFGMSQHPTVLDGALPLTVELLSPANRPIQRTADLPGFWSGSWSEVRKDMAGRYPKHSWPVDPSVSS